MNFDPYDKIIELNVRIGLLENYVKELQIAQIQTTERIKDQSKLIKQLQINQQGLDQVIGDIVLKR
jgi:hypothetical protein